MADLTLAQMLALLPDNTTGLIDAVDVRDVITALFERTDGTNAVDGMLFDTSPVIPAHTEGHLHWNASEGMLEIMSGTAGVTLQLGHEQWIEARNTTGATIANGRPVRLLGASGQRALVGPDIGQGRMIGVATHDIANNANGKITSFGLVRDINTSAFADGDIVYSTSTGTLTTSLTSSFIGNVLIAHATQGVLFVHTDRRTTSSGTTAERPTTVIPGFTYYDSTLGIPIFWTGTQWRNASGGVV